LILLVSSLKGKPWPIKVYLYSRIMGVHEYWGHADPNL